ncbi:MAG: hypothetical protein AAFO07_07345 [Bacteroidota bacterium]
MKTFELLFIMLIIGSLGNIQKLPGGLFSKHVNTPSNTNPIAAFYQETNAYPSWTDDIKWDNITLKFLIK